MHVLRSFFYRYGWDTRCRNLCPARLLRTALPASSRSTHPALLDVGSGELGLSAFLRGLSVVGSDLQPSIGRNGRCSFVRSAATALPFRDRSFPAVSCIDVLEHLAPAHRAEAITECVRVASRVVLFAFPDGMRARACDQAFQEACRRHSRQVPAWVEEHLRHEYPVSDGVAEQVRQAAAQLDRRAQLTASACEPLAICRLVRAAASRSTLLYALCNLWFGLGAFLMRAPRPGEGYRTVLVAELSPS